MRMSEEEYQAWLRGRAKPPVIPPLAAYPTRDQKRSKYGNKPTVVNGEQFDSGKEAARYEVLLLLERAGKISQLRHHVRYPLEVNGIVICEYECDFVYLDEHGRRHIEDVKCKATITQLYKIKRRLMAATHGITVEEVI